ncbi:MAG: hypothetical protein HDR04_16890, partial [Lachnospiraceae bacterium]|nr:hypothetical protein [Lachnospiraceae bacterium]
SVFEVRDYFCREKNLFWHFLCIKESENEYAGMVFGQSGGVRGRKGRGIVVWRNHRNLAWNCAGSCDKMKKVKMILNLQRHKKVSARTIFSHRLF